MIQLHSIECPRSMTRKSLDTDVDSDGLNDSAGSSSSASRLGESSDEFDLCGVKDDEDDHRVTYEDNEVKDDAPPLEQVDELLLPDNMPTVITEPEAQIPQHLLRTPVLVHSLEGSRKSRSLRFRHKFRNTLVDDLSLSLRTNDSTIATCDMTVPDFVVQFTTVTIRDFPRSIGDNPASSSGASVSIAWKHEREHTIQIDDYENSRGPRRQGREMILPPQLREDLLRQAGYSRAEIVRVIRDLNIVRGQRRRTYETLHLLPFQALSEKITRKAWNILTMGEFKRKERAILNCATRPTTSTKSKLDHDQGDKSLFDDVSMKDSITLLTPSTTASSEDIKSALISPLNVEVLAV
jgi:hypothetical protein